MRRGSRLRIGGGSSRIFGKPNDTGRTEGASLQDALWYHTLFYKCTMSGWNHIRGFKHRGQWFTAFEISCENAPSNGLGVGFDHDHGNYEGLRGSALKRSENCHVM